MESASVELESRAREGGLKGLVILAPEGLNATVCAETEQELGSFKKWLAGRFPGSWEFKDSRSDRRPFRKFVVKVRPEIVSLGSPDLVPGGDSHRHLSPREWDEFIDLNPEAVIVDTRNWYETRIGKFKGAISPETDQFSQFPEFMEKNGVSKDSKILIYCTGGIRCEKGILELERRGFSEVYQLKGGILAYLAEIPEGKFEGECFVFDDRVAVDRRLRPTEKYRFCVHCSQPATQRIPCGNCARSNHVCETCQEREILRSCSKNCAHHLELRAARADS